MVSSTMVKMMVRTVALSSIGSTLLVCVSLQTVAYYSSLFLSLISTKRIYFPALPTGAGWSFVEVARRHGDFALVGVAAVVALDGAGNCSDVRVALFGVAPTAVRSPSAEQALLGQKPDEQAIAAAAAEVAKDIDPPADVHASAAYRTYVATN